MTQKTIRKEYRGFDRRSASMFGITVVGHCFGADDGDSVVCMAGDIALFDSSVDIISGDVVAVERFDGKPAATDGIDGSAKYIEYLEGWGWWLRSQDGMFPLNETKYHRVTGRMVSSTHFRPQRQLEGKILALHEAAITPPEGYREALGIKSAPWQAMFDKGGVDRTTVFKHAGPMQRVPIRVSRIVAGFVVRHLVLPYIALALLVASPLLPQRWKQSWRRFAV